MIKKVYVFDLDDTLYKEIDFLKSGYKFICNFFNLQNEAYFDLLTWYKSKQNPFGNLIEKYHLDIQIKELVKIYREHKPNIQLNDEVKSFLNSVKNQENIKIGLITDGYSTTQRNKLLALGIIDFFDLIIISEEFGTEKPNIKNYKIFEKTFGLAEYYYLGDNINKDFVSPNYLGWTTICIQDNGENIHKQNRILEKKYYPMRSISTFANIFL